MKRDFEFSTQNAEESEILREYETGVQRKEVMNADARDQARRFFEEVRFDKGEVYQDMRGRLEKVFEPEAGKVSRALLKRATGDNGMIDEEYLVRSLELNEDEADVIFETVADGLFDALGVEGRDRPDIEIIYRAKDIPKRKDGKKPKGTFYHPSSQHAVTRNAKRNGKVAVFTPVFDETEFLPDMLETLAHECFHAYQMNAARGTHAPRSNEEALSQEVYAEDWRAQKLAKKDGSFARYYTQGREASAREFGEGAYQAMVTVVADAALGREY